MQFISLGMMLFAGLSRLVASQFPPLVVEKISRLFWKNDSSKLSNTGKLIPIVFGGANMTFQMQKRPAGIFVKQRQLVNSGSFLRIYGGSNLFIGELVAVLSS